MLSSTALLTPKELLADEASAMIGCWKLEPIINGKKQSFLIVEDPKGRFVLARTTPSIEVISKSDTLAKACLAYNNMVSYAQTHDLVVFSESQKVLQVR